MPEASAPEPVPSPPAPASEDQRAATPVTPTGSALAAAATGEACDHGVRQIRIGVEPGIPLSGGEVETRAMRVLEHAFPRPCYELTFESRRREDLAAAIVKDQIDLGVLAVASAASYAEQGVASLPAAEGAGVDMLMLHPASYAVVSAKPDAIPVARTGQLDFWVLLPGGLLAGVMLLALSAYFLNFRLPRPGRWATRASVRIDPRLARLGSATHWLYATSSGRLLGIIWAVLGGVVMLQMASPTNVVDAALEPDWQPLEGATLAAYPGRDVYELRDGRWKKCPRPFKCLHNYERGQTLALAGDRDVLCRYAADTHAAELDFMPDVAVPLLYALMLPPAATARPTGAQGLSSVLLEALQHEVYAGSPFRACAPPEADVVGRR